MHFSEWPIDRGTYNASTELTTVGEEIVFFFQWIPRSLWAHAAWVVRKQASYYVGLGRDGWERKPLYANDSVPFTVCGNLLGLISLSSSGPSNNNNEDFSGLYFEQNSYAVTTVYYLVVVVAVRRRRPNKLIIVMAWESRRLVAVDFIVLPHIVSGYGCC